MNIPLLLLDLICLPITLIRLFFIYLFGACYNVPTLQFLDVMMHATNRFFNQGSKDPTVDTISTDVRVSINRASRINAEVLYDIVHKSVAKSLAKPIAPIYEPPRHSIFEPPRDSIFEKKKDLSSPCNHNILNNMMSKKSDINPNKIDDYIKKELDFITYEISDTEESNAKNIDTDQVNPPSSRSGTNDLDLHTDDSKIFDSINSLT